MTRVTAGVIEAFAKDHEAPVELFSESLDAERFEAPGVFEANYRRKYAGQSFDAVIAVAPAAVRFVQERSQVLWPGVPIVCGGLSIPQYQNMRAPAACRVVATEFPYQETVQEALRLLPATKKVLLIFGCNARTRGAAETLLIDLRQRYPGKVIEDPGCLSIEEYRHQLANQPPRTLILWGDLSQDSKGRLQAAVQAARQIVPFANAPVVSIWPAHMDAGLLGGRMVNAEAVGEAMAREAMQAFRGEPPGQVSTAQGNWWMWDWRQLKRHGIAVSALPAGSQVVNRETSVWESYGEWILATILVGLAQLFLIAYLLSERSRREAAQSRMRELSGALIRAQEDERARIASELHDDLSQRMGLLTIGIEQTIGKTGIEAKPLLQRLAAQTREIFSIMHGLSHQLHPAKLSYLGLVPAVREVCQEVALRQGIDIDVEATELSGRLGPEQAISVYRVVQEALQNIVRHSEADEVKILISEDRQEFCAIIRDNGKGFEVTVATERRGLGLASMRERLRMVQGTLKVESLLGGGTTLQMRIPLEEQP